MSTASDPAAPRVLVVAPTVEAAAGAARWLGDATLCTPDELAGVLAAGVDGPVLVTGFDVTGEQFRAVTTQLVSAGLNPGVLATTDPTSSHTATRTATHTPSPARRPAPGSRGRDGEPAPTRARRSVRQYAALAALVVAVVSVGLALATGTGYVGGVVTAALLVSLVSAGYSWRARGTLAGQLRGVGRDGELRSLRRAVDGLRGDVAVLHAEITEAADAVADLGAP